MREGARDRRGSFQPTCTEGLSSGMAHIRMLLPAHHVGKAIVWLKKGARKASLFLRDARGGCIGVLTCNGKGMASHLLHTGFIAPSWIASTMELNHPNPAPVFLGTRAPSSNENSMWASLWLLCVASLRGTAS